MSLSFSGFQSGVVDAVDEFRRRDRRGADDAVEAVAEFGSLDFLRVFSADSGQVIGINQAGFQEIDDAIEFDARRGEVDEGIFRRDQVLPCRKWP